MKLFAHLVLVVAIVCLSVAAGALVWWFGFLVAGLALGVYGLFVEVDDE